MALTFLNVSRLHVPPDGSLVSEQSGSAELLEGVQPYSDPEPELARGAWASHPPSLSPSLIFVRK